MSNSTDLIDPADRALLYSLYAIGSLGLLLNAFLLIVILAKKTLRQKEYILFLISRIIIDSVFSMNVLIMQPMAIQSWISNPMLCQATGAIGMSLIFCVLFSEPVLALNRYFSVCRGHQYDKIYKRSHIIIMCILVWLLAFGIIVPSHFAEGALGRVPGLFCSVIPGPPWLRIGTRLNYPILFMTHAITAFCYVKIYRQLRGHHAQTGSNIPMSRLEEDKSLLRYIGLSALLPILAELPMAVVIIVRLVNSSLVPPMAMFASSVVFLLLPIIGPLSTLLIVRPVRKAAMAMVKGVANNTSILVQSVNNALGNQWQIRPV